MRRKTLISLLLLALVCGGACWAYSRLRPGGHPSGADEPAAHAQQVPQAPSEPGKEGHLPAQSETTRAARAEQAALQLFGRVPVPNNRGPEVPDGFRGDVHPLLRRHAEMEVRAYWKAAAAGNLFPDRSADLDPVRRLFTEVRVAVPSRSYSERDFSAFLPPETVQAAGQLWALDPERVVAFSRQFHPAVSAHSASGGRRPGPDGAFAVLQGVSSSYLDILFRVHAEFDLAPKSGHFPALYAWYTPACFLGRIVVNRRAGVVEYFQLGVPTDEVKNIHGTVWIAPDEDNPQGDALYQFLRADRMELVGGSLEGLGGVRWADRVETGRAHEQLAKAFYKFKEIDFMPFPQALATARARNKPIFAVVPLGALDDQSC